MGSSIAHGPEARPEPVAISVAMCTCNGAPFLEQQLDSIARQGLPPMELVVCDDASTDASPSILEAFAARSPFPVRIYRNPTRLGTRANFAKAIGLCSGDIVALADQDDIWMPEKLEVFRGVFASAPSVVAVCSDALLVDEDAHSLHCRLWEAMGFEPPPTSPEAGFALLEPRVLLKRNVVTGATLAFRARLCSEVGPAHMPLIHDYSIALLAALQGDVALVGRPLIHYRQHPNQQIGAPLHRPGEERRKPGVRKRWVSKQHKESNMYRALSAALSTPDEVAGQAGAFRATARHYHAHLGFRLSLPQGRACRLWTVLKGLLAGYYRLGAKPLKAALRDAILAPPREGLTDRED